LNTAAFFSSESVEQSHLNWVGEQSVLSGCGSAAGKEGDLPPAVNALEIELLLCFTVDIG